jgi:hypothetical protein
MTRIVGYPRVEDIVHRVPPEKEITDYPNGSAINLMSPQSPEVRDSVKALLFGFHPHHKAIIS